MCYSAVTDSPVANKAEDLEKDDFLFIGVNRAVNQSEVEESGKNLLEKKLF